MRPVDTDRSQSGHLQIITDFDEQHWLEEAMGDAARSVKGLETYTDSIMDRLKGVQATGDLLPWKVTHDLVRLRPKEVSIWAGVNGHGKSQILGQVAAWLLPVTQVMIASFEMPPEATGARMIRQCAGLRQPSREFVDRFCDWSFGKLWLYDEASTVKPEHVFALTCYAARELRCKHIIIDSLMKCGINGEDLSGQKRFVDMLCQMAKRYDVHISIVHHMRKGEREGKRPDKFDIRGASEITDLVDNVFIIHRNKDKERKLMNREEVPANVPDSVLTVAKQRHGEWEGDVLLWFDRDSQQYLKSPDAQALPWPNADDRWLVKWAKG